jgi:transposase
VPEFDPQRGLDFPIINGEQSSQATGKAVFADAARATDPALAVRTESVRSWRKEYLEPVRDLVVSGLKAQGGTVRMSRDGLDSLHRRFEFTRDGEVLSVAEAFAGHTEPGYATAEVAGAGRPSTELVVPYHGRPLSGAALNHQLDVWVAEGQVEPSFARAVSWLVAHPEKLDLTGEHFAVLGVGSEMGPTKFLLDHGATVWGVDLPRPDLWRRVITDAQGRAGRLMVPVPAEGGMDRSQLRDQALAAVAGADLLTRGPEIRTWLAGIPGAFTLGNYVYADGPVHVRASLAIDAISMDLIGSGRDIMLAWLATATDVFATPMEAVEESRRRWKDAGLWRPLRSPLKYTGYFQKNYPDTVWTADGVEYGICDCLVPQQGPNYILAKRLQRWRAMAAREDGVRVSLNVAPSTRTYSVTKNRAMAAAYAGAGRFGLEIFDPETSNAIMGALLVHDLRNPEASANPEVKLAHPMQLFIEGACHGGMWRSQYASRSVLGVAAVMGMFERRA